MFQTLIQIDMQVGVQLTKIKGIRGYIKAFGDY